MDDICDVEGHVCEGEAYECGRCGNTFCANHGDHTIAACDECMAWEACEEDLDGSDYISDDDLLYLDQQLMFADDDDDDDLAEDEDWEVWC